MKKEEIKKGTGVRIFNFNEAYEPPIYKYDAKLGIVTWGAKNDYPTYLLDLYNDKGSATHKSIINKKVRLIAGKGFNDVENELLSNFIKVNELAEHAKRAALDFEIFNAFAFEVIWSNDKESITSIQHLPIHKLRIGIEGEGLEFPHMWYSNDWKKYKKEGYEPEMIPMFDDLNRGGKQVYVYVDYNPATDGLYPIPTYSEIFNWIETDYQISKFHLNQVKQGYSPSFILNFATGIPSEEEQDEFFKHFKRNYSGTENSGKIILTYSEGVEQQPELTPIQLNDTDERFVMLQETIERNIVTGHEIPAAMAILTPGKLGSTQEREELLNEFQQSYLTPRQEGIEAVLNILLAPNGYGEELTLQTYIDDKGGTAKAELRGSSQGVQGVIQIQQSVAQGLTDISSAVALLEIMYGFDNADALRLLGGEQEDNNNNNNI